MTKTFRATLADGAVTLPFDPDEAWGVKGTHHVRGTVDGKMVRGPLDGGRLLLGPAWLRDNGPLPEEFEVVLAPEGPQRGDLPPDFLDALSAEPEALAHFEALATYYRKGWLTWLDGAKREPKRSARIAEIVAALREGRKSR